jgi:hypothetical protein
VVDIPEAAGRLVAQGTTVVENVAVSSNGILEEQDGRNRVCQRGYPAGAEVQLSGDFSRVSVEAQGRKVTVASARFKPEHCPQAVSAAVSLNKTAKWRTSRLMPGTCPAKAKSPTPRSTRRGNYSSNSANTLLPKESALMSAAEGRHDSSRRRRRKQRWWKRRRRRRRRRVFVCYSHSHYGSNCEYFLREHRLRL